MNQFFRDLDNAKSMTRLCYFIACAVSSVVVLWQTYLRGISSEMLGVYLATFGAVYASNKYQERKLAQLPDEKQKQ